MKTAVFVVFLLLGVLSNIAHAALIHFDGNIKFHNDIIQIDFTLNQDVNNIRVWTDSFQDGINFDPITALWSANGALIQEDDDNAHVNPSTQTDFDSGFELPFLAAGDYIFTVATYNNFAQGSVLSDGFLFDSQAPVELADWTQPANGINMGPYWSVWLDGVDAATNPNVPVPAPSSLLLFALALVMLRLKKS
ncbi:PEP-CTERM sorting domain-containing protein [Alteromonas sp. BL110]|uniref:DVUA0089 family protein n=1 Tax=Alteromonas sp. BL110 TaxID=1714845 RepID=UPI000E47230A|nr:DVUA0089 family protein [Alteromonas sp. BL110]AXT40071.1 PEP-CTERM sorting domain-containing protein [Alteromonas sp. BL110]RKM79301.1 PEP-CTERM sorting domain-containing protein [Alteromonas sp. BL110]